LGSVRNIFSQIAVPTCSHSGEHNHAPRLYRPPQWKGRDLPPGIGHDVCEALVSVSAPEDDRFQVVCEHDADNLLFDPDYLGIQRSDDLVVIQITWNEGRRSSRSTRRLPIGCRQHPASGRRTSSSTSSRPRRMLGLKSTVSAARHSQCHDELRNFLRCRSRIRQHVPATTRRWHHMRTTGIALLSWQPPELVGTSVGTCRAVRRESCHNQVDALRGSPNPA
jgi:Tautomerase enzyme